MKLREWLVIGAHRWRRRHWPFWTLDAKCCDRWPERRSWLTRWQEPTPPPAAEEPKP